MSIYKKLAKAKKEIGVIAKDSKNPFFKSSYLSLNGLIDAVEPILETHGLLLLQPIFEGKVRTEIIDVESSEKVISEIDLPTINDAQKLGSAITYFRRYTLQSLLSAQAEDDDGNAAKKKTDRGDALTETQYHQLLLPENKQHIKSYMHLRMTPTQKEELTKLMNK